MAAPIILYIASEATPHTEQFLEKGKAHDLELQHIDNLTHALATLLSLEKQGTPPAAVVLRRSLAAMPGGPVFESAGDELANAIRASCPLLMMVGYGPEWSKKSHDLIDLHWADETRDDGLLAALAAKSRQTRSA